MRTLAHGFNHIHKLSHTVQRFSALLVLEIRISAR
jgi:hypothetical protein